MQQLSACNMFICGKELFDEYSKWLFDILFEVEKRVTISTDPIQARIFGYMSERLLNVFVHHNRLRVKYLPVILVSDEIKPISRPILFVRRILSNFIFFISGKNSLL